MPDQATRSPGPISLRFTQLRVPLKVTFRQASSTRTHGESIWCEARRGDVRGYGEGCPRRYVTGETLESCADWLNARLDTIGNSCVDLETLNQFSTAHERDVDSSPSAWCAVECALLDLFARERGVSVEGLLGQPGPGGPMRYSAIVGNDEPWKTWFLLDQYMIQGFNDFKLKLSGDIDEDRQKISGVIEIAAEHGRSEIPRIRLDANNRWHKEPDAALPYLRSLEAPFFAIEEPVYPGDVETHSKISVALNTPVILDESLCTLADLERYTGVDGSFIANIKISRVGGPVRALRLVDALVERGWPIIVGAHAGETSVLTRAAMMVARAAGDSLIAQEGAFGGRLLEREPVKPSLEWGRAGELDVSKPYGVATPEGLTITPPTVWQSGWGLDGRFPAAHQSSAETETETMSDAYVVHSARWGKVEGGEAIVILHGGMSHSGWQSPLAELLHDRSGLTVIAPDRRGCGLNAARGDLQSAERTIDDVVEHLQHLAKRYERIHLAGWCQGGQWATIAATRIQDELPLASLLLITPGFFWNARFRSVIDSTERVVQKLLDHFDSEPDRLEAFVPIPLTPTDFTLSSEWLDYVDSDQLKTTEITLRSVVVMDEVQTLSWESVPKVHVPTFALFASDDRIVDNAKALNMFGPFWENDDRHEVVRTDGPHAIHFSRSEWLADKMLNFIKRSS